MKSTLSHNRQLIEDYRRANSRQFWLDYDGSLVPFADRPEDAAPTDEVLDLLQKLGEDARNRVIVISGRDADSMGKWLGRLPIELVAEHGAFLKRRGKGWEPFLTASPLWKSKIAPSLRALTHHYEGSYLEEKEFSLVWHYREIAERVWPEDISQILEALPVSNPHPDAVIYREACSVEVRSRGIDKGNFFRQSPWKSQPVDFGLVLGDGHTDEDLFVQAPKFFYTIKVGSPQGSAARHHLPFQRDVLPFLRELVTLSQVGIPG